MRVIFWYKTLTFKNFVSLVSTHIKMSDNYLYVEDLHGKLHKFELCRITCFEVTNV